MSVILETSKGDITVDLYTEERPRCCMNFLKLCKIKYYNTALFHSVQRNFIAQTGDPTGTGDGGVSIFAKLYGEQAAYFEQEVKPRIKHTKLGTLSMVNNGNSMHGSQFFITLAKDLDYLDNTHTVFGEVAEGFDVIENLNEAIVDKDNRPYQDIRIFHTVILDDPYDDPPGLEEHIPAMSPIPTKEDLDSGRIGVDENIDDFEGKTVEEIEEILKDKAAKANAQLLEMVGDLPDAEVAPDENVLFVCKLNPVTTSEDLEIIFSRFGKINSCEVIKDQKSGESLQYAFIEFAKRADCENAYFKMDNVLIDDRRIHVDFSQSVAKLKGKQKEDDDDRPKFIIKDRSRKDDRYALVMSDEEEKSTAKDTSGSSKKSKKKKKKHKKQSSSDESDTDSDLGHKRQKHSKSKSSRGRSRSPLEDRHHSSRSDRDTKDRHWDRGDRYKEQERSKDHRRDKERDRDRDRYRESDRNRESDRDRRRDYRR